MNGALLARSANESLASPLPGLSGDTDPRQHLTGCQQRLAAPAPMNRRDHRPCAAPEEGGRSSGAVSLTRSAAMKQRRRKALSGISRRCSGGSGKAEIWKSAGASERGECRQWRDGRQRAAEESAWIEIAASLGVGEPAGGGRSATAAEMESSQVRESRAAAWERSWRQAEENTAKHGSSEKAAAKQKRTGGDFAGEERVAEREKRHGVRVP